LGLHLGAGDRHPDHVHEPGYEHGYHYGHQHEPVHEYEYKYKYKYKHGRGELGHRGEHRRRACRGG
jgi:hypothetical protein